MKHVVRRYLPLVALAAMSGRARATGDAFLDILPGAPPMPRVIIVGDQASNCVLLDGRLSVAASSVTDADPTDALAIVLVFQGEAFELEDDEYAGEDRLAGPVVALANALDRHDWTALGPTNSRFELVSYATAAMVRRSWSPLSELRGRALGPAKGYLGSAGADLVHGIELGIAELEHFDAPRRVLIVFGDGIDRGDTLAKPRLELVREARAHRIDSFGIIYKSAISGDNDVLSEMIPTARRANSYDDIARELEDVTRRIRQRSVVMFPGETLNWDGAYHDVTVRCAAVEARADELFPIWQPPPRWPALARDLLLSMCVVVVIGAVARHRRRRLDRDL